MQIRIGNKNNWILTSLLAAVAAVGASAQPYVYVSNSGANSVVVLNSVNNAVVATVPVGIAPAGLALTPDGAYIYVPCQGSAMVYVISTVSNAVVATVPVGTTPIKVAPSPSGAQVYVVNRGSNNVSVIDTASKTVIGTIPVGARPLGVAFSPDGANAYVAALLGANVSIIDTASQTVEGTFAAGSGPNAVIVTPSGHVYVSNQYSSTVTVHDSAGNLLNTVSGMASPNSLAVAPNGSRILATNGNGGSVSVIDSTGAGSLIATVPTGSIPTGVAVTPDGAHAYVANEYSFTVSVLDMTTNTVVNNIPHLGPYPQSVATVPAAQGPPPCTFTLSQTSATFGAAGGPGSVNVTPSASCGGWTAVSNVSWIAITAGASGSGAGTVSYLVTPNIGSAGLSGTITIAGQTYTVTEAGFSCTYSISANSNTFSSGGGPGTVNVTAPSGCPWTAASNIGWAAITSGASGSGAGAVAYSVNPNTSSITRSGTLTIAGQTYTITESGAACTYTLSANSNSFPPSGGPGTVNVSSPAGCAWTAASNVGWASITSGASGSGNGTVGYSVGANSSSATQSGTLTVAGQTYTITESGVACTYTLSANSNSFPPSGGPGTVNVTSPAGCAWTAASNVGWASITSGASGSGNGAVGYSVATNTGSVTQSGTLTVAGQTYTITESGVACTYTLSANSNSFPPSGGPGTVNVTSPAGCAWTAVSNAGWTTITSGASGSGNGTVGYSVGANSGSTTQSGTLTVAGQTYTITESGVACTYTLSANSNSFSASGGPGTVNVTSQTGCAWTAVSNAGWTTITSGASGSGNGTVGYSVGANSGSTTQSGTLTVAGQTYTITESGTTCTYTLSANSGSFSPAGGPGTVNVTSPAGCAWTAASNVGWTTITSGASGSGNGAVGYSVGANNSSVTQSGTLTIAGHTYTVTETGVACTYSLSANSGSFSSSGGPGTVNVTSPVGCAWTAASNVGWATIASGASGSGNGAVGYSVGANNSSVTQNGTLTVAGQTYTITESGMACTYSLSSNSNSFLATGGTGSVNVIAPAGCVWTAASNVGWTTILSGASGSGNGSVAYSSSPNIGTGNQSGTLTIAGLTFTINESGVACSYSLSSNSISMGSGSGSGSVNITTLGGCAWSASSDSTWLTMSAGTAGTGSGTVSYSVSANSNLASRTGNLTIGGQTFAVTQTGVAFSAIRTHCGGPQVLDSNGNVWAPDNAANYSVTNAAIANTAVQPLYQTEAWSTGTLQYQYAVPNGSYTVQLKFAEFYMTAIGQRTFNIVVNGNTFYSAFDILAHAGPNSAYDVSVPVVVNNGEITIQLVPVTGSPKLNALQITTP